MGAFEVNSSVLFPPNYISFHFFQLSVHCILIRSVNKKCTICATMQRQDIPECLQCNKYFFLSLPRRLINALVFTIQHSVFHKKKSVKKVQKIREIAIKIDTKNAYKKCNFHNEAVTLHFFRCSKVYLKFQFFIYFNALRDYSSLL